jgi:hypothetical protein
MTNPLESKLEQARKRWGRARVIAGGCRPSLPKAPPSAPGGPDQPSAA